MAFPSGKVLSQALFPASRGFFRSSDPGFIIIPSFGARSELVHTEEGRAVKEVSSNRTAAAQLATGRVIISETPALDVMGHFYVTQPAPDEVGLYEIGKGLLHTVALHAK